jgi:hypothetical protein
VVQGQADSSSGPVIDTIVVNRSNVFDQQETQSSAAFRVMNKLHITTHEWVIRKELLFRQGQPYDSARVAESERILRNRQIFRELSFDTTRLDGKFAVVVNTQDGWSTKPKFKFSVASDGNWTGTFGINEINLLGTGNQAYVAYVKEVDRDGLNLSAKFNRVLSTNMDISGNYAGLSDGKNGNWLVGYPFRALETQGALQYDGLAANQRILQYSVPDAGTLDTVTYRRTAFVNNVTGGIATSRSPLGYVRVVGMAGIRREEYVLEQNGGTDVPDTITATIGAYGEFSRAKFQSVRRFNGFGGEDIDLSTTFRLTMQFAPAAFGWNRAGIGPWIGATAAEVVGKGFVWGALDANGLFNSAGLDSGRVVMNLAFGYKFHPRHSTALQVQAGVLDNVAPGQEFDLGFNNPPRSWEPHSFVGTRELWASFEHRWFVWDALFNLAGVGFAGFLDYGGAWYKGEPSRFGGNVGAGLRMGSALTTVPITGRVDLGYRFGDDVVGSRWVLSFGTGFVFPRRTIPVIPYTAQPPP